MRVPVILALPSDLGRLRGAPVPPVGFEMDSAARPVPIGPSRRGLVSTKMLSESDTDRVAVRGTVEAARLEDVPEQMGGADVFSDPPLTLFRACYDDPAVGERADVERLLDLAKLRAAGLDGQGVAVAIVDNGINVGALAGLLGCSPAFDAANSWTPPGGMVPPGQYPVGHGTLCAYSALIAAPGATLLDMPGLAPTGQGGSTIAPTLSSALLAYAHLLAFWAVAFSPTGAGKYGALVVSNSWGMPNPALDFPPGHPGRYGDNPNHPFNVVTAALARANADILFAGGNCGTDCPMQICPVDGKDTIAGAAALSEVLTVAGCDTTDRRVGYSSQGPAPAGMPGQKPDLAGYTHFRGSELEGPGMPDRGTSVACPLTAGCIAAIRTKVRRDRVPSADLFRRFRQAARPVEGQAGRNDDVGHGMVDPVAVARSLGIPV